MFLKLGYVELQLSILYLANDSGEVCSNLAMKGETNQWVVLAERWDLYFDLNARSHLGWS